MFVFIACSKDTCSKNCIGVTVLSYFKGNPAISLLNLEHVLFLMKSDQQGLIFTPILHNFYSQFFIQINVIFSGKPARMLRHLY